MVGEELQRTGTMILSRTFLLLRVRGRAWERWNVKESALFFLHYGENCFSYAEERINGEEDHEETGKMNFVMGWGPEDWWGHRTRAFCLDELWMEPKWAGREDLPWLGHLPMPSLSFHWDDAHCLQGSCRWFTWMKVACLKHIHRG